MMVRDFGIGDSDRLTQLFEKYYGPRIEQYDHSSYGFSLGVDPRAEMADLPETPHFRVDFVGRVPEDHGLPATFEGIPVCVRATGPIIADYS